MQRSAAVLFKLLQMRKKRKEAPAVQLCLFSETEMDAMCEYMKPLKRVELFTADPERLRWQLEIGQSLRGKEGREYRRMYAARRRRVKVHFKKPPDLFIKT